MSEDTKQDEPVVLNLQDLVPKPAPEIFTLLGAAEAGIKSIRKALDAEPANQPAALLRATTVKAALVSIEALLQHEVTDTMLKVQSLALGSQLADMIGKEKAALLSEAKDKGSGYL